MFMYRVAEPNEALIISGFRAHHGPEGDAAGMGFKIVVGKGAGYVPGLQKVRRLSLDIHEAELDLECVTTQGLRVGVKAVVIYKIADDLIRNRDALTKATRESSASEMQRLGLTIDSLQIQEIEDHSDYISNLAM